MIAIAVNIIIVILLGMIYSPLPLDRINRIISSITGLCSLFIVWLPSVIYRPTRLLAYDDRVQYDDYMRYSSTVIILFVALLVVGFARQMVLERRNHMVQSLSNNVINAIGTVGVTGWFFAPSGIVTWYELCTRSSSDMLIASGVLIVFILAVLALCSAVFLWYRDHVELRGSSNPILLLGYGCLLLMMIGLLVYVASFLTFIFIQQL